MPIILFAAVVMIGMYHWTNIEDGYKALGFPWWKRPSPLVLFVVVALIVAMLNP